MTPQDVRVQRKQLGLSQVRLANLAGVSRFRLTLWESGDGPLTEEELARVISLLRHQAATTIEALSELAGAHQLGGST